MKFQWFTWECDAKIALLYWGIIPRASYCSTGRSIRWISTYWHITWWSSMMVYSDLPCLWIWKKFRHTWEHVINQSQNVLDCVFLGNIPEDPHKHFHIGNTILHKKENFQLETRSSNLTLRIPSRPVSKDSAEDSQLWPKSLDLQEEEAKQNFKI